MDSPQDDRYRQLVLAARRPLSLAELHSAFADSHDTTEDPHAALVKHSQGELEVSGGIRPIVQFKAMTDLVADVAAHTAAASSCLRAFKHAKDNWPNYGNSRQQVLHSSKLPFLKYAVEHIFVHTDRADDMTKEAFCQAFEYEEWQNWAIHLPVYAAINTYRFGGALTRCKCPALLLYIMQHHRLSLREGNRASGYYDTFTDPLSWRGGYSMAARRNRHDYIATSRRLAAAESSRRSSEYSRYARYLADDAMESPLDIGRQVPEQSTAASEEQTNTQTARSASPAASTFSFEHLALATPAASKADQASVWSFEDLNESPHDDDLCWEEVEYQAAILESLQHAVPISTASESVYDHEDCF